MTTDVTLQRKTGVAMLSIISNTSLVLLKLIVGMLIGSVSIISEAIHSGVDLLAAIIALVAVRTAGKPADEEHPYGHGKYENVSGTVEALLIFLAAAWIIYEAAHKLMKPQPIETVGWGIAVMLVSSLANLLISARLFKVGKETDSVALQADAWHLRTDVYTSAGVLVGLAIILLGKYVFPGTNLNWVDPVAAIAVALLIIKAAWSLTIESGRDLLDARLNADEESWIRDLIHTQYPDVRGFHHLHTRKSGSMRFVELHLLVDAGMSVQDSHRISDQVTADIKSKFPESRVLIHVEPCAGECTQRCVAGCMVVPENRPSSETDTPR